ncbi:hypothetical protein BDV98DRAFT_576452 [Pterulicium gracile]|uniref:Uncharacterized protein n=1 Tax=Pterulicium gracile TaxID=1884261 RepID=A0A5C3Q2A8_9AGAR|nr:hypothetical protein BDV98DRAFT_576452 [Pterula gracilis]
MGMVVRLQINSLAAASSLLRQSLAQRPNGRNIFSAVVTPSSRFTNRRCMRTLYTHERNVLGARSQSDHRKLRHEPVRWY